MAVGITPLVHFTSGQDFGSFSHQHQLSTTSASLGNRQPQGATKPAPAQPWDGDRASTSPPSSQITVSLGRIWGHLPAPP